MTEQQAQELIERLDTLIALMERIPYVYPVPVPTYPQPYYPNPIPTYPNYPITICTTDSTKDYRLT